MSFKKNSPLSLCITLNKAQSSHGPWTTAALQNFGGKSLVQITGMLPLVQKCLLNDLEYNGNSCAGARTLSPVCGVILSLLGSETQL